MKITIVEITALKTNLRKIAILDWCNKIWSYDDIIGFLDDDNNLPDEEFEDFFNKVKSNFKLPSKNIDIEKLISGCGNFVEMIAELNKWVEEECSKICMCYNEIFDKPKYIGIIKDKVIINHNCTCEEEEVARFYGNTKFDIIMQIYNSSYRKTWDGKLSEFIDTMYCNYNVNIGGGSCNLGRHCFVEENK